MPVTPAVLQAATSTRRPHRDAHGRIVLTPRWKVQSQGKGKPPNLIERGPVREEYAAPWRHKITVAALQEEMSNRSAKWRTVEVSEERRELINQVMVETTSMWIQSLQHTVWPNIVYMVSEEIGRRSRRGREKACLICHQKCEFAGNNMEHNLFHCPMAHHASDEIDLAAWQAMVSHPFRMQSGAKRIDQQLCYLGSLLQVWENAADVGMVTPWTLVLIKYCFMFPNVCCVVRMCYISLPLLFRMLRTHDQLCIAPTELERPQRAAPEGLPRHVRVGLGRRGRTEPTQSGWGHWATASSRDCGGKFRGRRAGSADNKPSGHRAGRAAVGTAAVGPSSR